MHDYDFSCVSSTIQSWVDKGYYPGASILIGRGDKVLFERTYGTYTPATVVYIASAGKWLAAATIASVVDEGKLSWDDPASKWIPELSPGMGKATLRQLLSHTSGYPDYQPDGRRRDDYQTLSESVANIVPLTIDDAPGTRFHYGGLAMQVAGRMAELATGKDWESLFQERIAHPLGMTATRFTPVDLGGGHSPMLGGGARATLRDYARFLEMIQGDGVYRGKRILSHASIAGMQADQVRGARVDPGGEYVERAYGQTYNGIYGLGEWRDEIDPQGNATLISSPSWAGALPWIDKTRGVYGIFLTHVDVSQNGPAARDKFSGFWASPALPIMVRHALDTGDPPHFRSGMLDIGTTSLYYEKAGHGPAVILMHAHSADCREWDPQFAQLAKRYTVVRFDFRGYGRSKMPIEGEEFTHAGDVLRLMDNLGIKKANLVGLSLGGLVGTDFLALHPERVASLTVASGAIHQGPDIPTETPEQHAERERERTESQKAGIAATLAEGIPAFKKHWFDSLMKSCAPHSEPIRPALWQMIEDWSAWQPAHIEAHVLLDTPVAPKIAAQDHKIPVLIIKGRYDSDGSHRSSDALAAIYPGAKVVTLQRAGHFSNMESPAEFNKALEGFLSSVNARNASDR